MNKLNHKSKINFKILYLLILLNFYFIPRTGWHINHFFAGLYHSIIPMFISLIINGSLLTAQLAIQKNKQSLFLLIINLIAVVFAVLYFIIEISSNLERGQNWYYNLF